MNQKQHLEIEKAETEKALEEFKKYEERLIGLITFFIEHGCDPNAQVMERKSEVSKHYKNWGIQHFLMMHPSIKLLRFFSGKVRDFNAVTALKKTPLHLFCQNTTSEHILQSNLSGPEEYLSDNILKELLTMGLKVDTLDHQKAYPFLYAAENGRFDFMEQLALKGSPLNFCTINNQVPCIEVVKKSSRFTLR